jgi:ribonucleoside-diphosphate reductase alpha chain
MTGIASAAVLPLDMKAAASIVKRENTRIAKLIGINKAARCTTVKPAGTTSLVLGTSSGIHAWHNKYYIRRLRVGKNEAIYSYLKSNHPELLEDDYFRPHDTAVISIPQSAPKGSIIRTEKVMDMLERVKLIASEWVKPGHRAGSNSHNVSATVSVKSDEWKQVGEWMWENKSHYNGLSVLPYDGGTYVQAPFEDITKKQFDEMVKTLHNVDLSRVVESDDNTDLSGEIACSGGVCDITDL